MTRRFVLVTVALSTGTRDQAAAGIRKLKRGVSLPQFITDYLGALEIEVDEQHILKRDDTYTVIKAADGAVSTWNFTEFSEDDLFHAVSHLSKDELLRDLKELLPLKAR